MSAYELRYLGEHLAQLGDRRGLLRLLTLEYADGDRRRTAWYDAKEAIEDAVGYRADVDRGSRLARRPAWRPRAPASRHRSPRS